MNPSSALATVIVAALAELGVRHVVLCPGSRSAPLAYALAEAAGPGRPGGVTGGAGSGVGVDDRAGLNLHVRIDERSAGFLALGLARGDDDGAPAVVVTTSGTAVANLHPAVLEAAHSGVPLLVVSADRPHELRGTGASQTTDQVQMFGTAVRWFAEIPAPQRRPGQVGGWRNVVSRAVAAARGRPGGDPGPVQLNVAFADPLVPDHPPAPGADPEAWPEPLSGGAGLTVVAPAGPPVTTWLPSGPRTVVVAGDGAGPRAAWLAAAAGWPLLAEPSSGARTGDAVGAYRLLLDRPELGGAVQRVVVFGRPTLSRPIGALLARPDVEVVVVADRPDWTDPARRATQVVAAVEARPEPDDGPGPVWAARWQRAGRAVTAAIDDVLDRQAASGRPTGALVARLVAAATGADDVLFAGSSNPIRDLDLMAGPFDSAAVVLANRGLAGIDGTVSTAAGVALARAARSGHAGLAAPAGRVRCLVGDLTLLHDAGGLLGGLLEERPQLQVVVVDDGGGGIFELLEHGRLAAREPHRRTVFERVFGTPQDVDLAALCAGYRVAHRLVTDLTDLPGLLASPPPGISVLQVRIDRRAGPVLAAELRRVAEHAARDLAGTC